MTSPTFVTCRDCGAECPAHAAQCWLCHKRLSDDTADLMPGDHTFTASRAQAHAKPMPRTNDSSTLIAILVTIVLVGAGIAYEAPGLAIVYAMVVLPAIVATLIKRERRVQSDAMNELGDTIADFLGSLAITFGILLLLPIVAVIAFGIFCAIVLATGSFR